MGSNYDYTKLNGAYAIWKFFLTRNGTLILYWLYNKDDGIRKDSGIVFEFVLHELIQRFLIIIVRGFCLKIPFF